METSVTLKKEEVMSIHKDENTCVDQQKYSFRNDSFKSLISIYFRLIFGLVNTVNTIIS